MIKVTAAALGAAMSFSAIPAQAAYTITLEEVGSDVVATGFGSLKTASFRSTGTSAFDSLIQPERGVILAGESDPARPLQFFDANFQTQPYFGSGGLARPTSSTGPLVGIVGVLYNVAAPFYYISGTDLGTSTSRYENSSFSSLGLIKGQYVFDLGRGADTFTVNIGAPVPEPATWTMMMLGFGAIGYALRRQKAHTAARFA